MAYASPSRRHHRHRRPHPSRLGRRHPSGQSLQGRQQRHQAHSRRSTPRGLTTRFAGEIPGFDAKKYLDKKERKEPARHGRGIQLAVAAAQLALDHGKVDKTKLDPTRFGVEFGAGLLATELPELGPAAQVSCNGQPGAVDLKTWGEQGLAAITPLWMLKYLPNMLACHVSILHNAQGPNNTITESDVAPLLALGEAARILRRNQADFFLVGGADSKINPLSMVRQCLFGHLSQRNDAPEKACRPFDRDRDGVVSAREAACWPSKTWNTPRQRGATILGEVVGFGSAFDRGMTGPGLARAIRAALQQARHHARTTSTTSTPTALAPSRATSGKRRASTRSSAIGKCRSGPSRATSATSAPAAA